MDSSARFPDRLLHNPWAQPPSAIDWQVQPTYQRRTVPYYLAPLWDSHFAAREQAKSSNKPLKANHKDGSPDVQSQIPKDLRLKLKHARAARGLLRDLEEKIRLFVQRYYEKQVVSAQDEDEVELDGAPSLLSDEEKWEKLQDKAETETETEKECDSDDDEIVFVGRKGRMLDASANHNRTPKVIHPDVDRAAKEKVGEKMVFESLEGDRAAGFGFVLNSIFASSPSPYSLRNVSPLLLSFFIRFFQTKLTNLHPAAGWSTLSPPTTACAPGPLQSAIPPVARRTLASIVHSPPSINSNSSSSRIVGTLCPQRRREITARPYLQSDVMLQKQQEVSGTTYSLSLCGWLLASPDSILVDRLPLLWLGV